ncbi:hypothetical protein NDU88_001841 [Pleurodeles waltl]|uniref:Uncharacterized protein n=1 Tax=Pleurodeles waltl TaxID=8319 RepID=A0AAV7Q749_PLEWA|nr:hypothetical protein NDU88_001841 [Pleurodeles waltl]
MRDLWELEDSSMEEINEEQLIGRLESEDVVARVYQAPLAVRSSEGIAKYKCEDIYLAAPVTDILSTRPLHRFRETVHTESSDTGVAGRRERPGFRINGATETMGDNPQEGAKALAERHKAGLDVDVCRRQQSRIEDLLKIFRDTGVKQAWQ